MVSQGGRLNYVPQEVIKYLHANSEWGLNWAFDRVSGRIPWEDESEFNAYITLRRRQEIFAKYRVDNYPDLVKAIKKEWQEYVKKVQAVASRLKGMLPKELLDKSRGDWKVNPVEVTVSADETTIYVSIGARPFTDIRY